VCTILILADSHGDTVNILWAVRENPDVDIIVHLGDCYTDINSVRREITKELVAIGGNLDRNEVINFEKTLEYDSKKILLTHGHWYNVKTGFEEIAEYGRKKNYDLVAFGHTHKPYLGKYNKLILFNPGSILQGNYGIVKINKRKIICVSLMI